MTSTDWMDKESTRMAGTIRQTEAHGQQRLEGSIKAQQGAPDFWKEFTDEVKVQADGLAQRFTYSMDENIVGHSSLKEADSTYPDHHCTVGVDRHSMEFGSESAVMHHFYYRPGSSQIKRSVWRPGSVGVEDNVFIDLYAGPQGTLADVKGSGRTAKELAIYIVRGMYETVKFPAIPKAAQGR
jgi:hypothetical protein